MSRLTDDEQAYHERLIATLRAAQAAWESWSSHLTSKYRLGERDAITPQGEIVRGPLPEEVAEPES